MHLASQGTDDNSSFSISIGAYIPSGFSWSQNSCAYDSILSIIHSIWVTNVPVWSGIFNLMNSDLLGNLATDFAQCKAGVMRLDSARDRLHRKMSSISQNKFGWGRFTSIEEVLKYLLTMPTITIESSQHCEMQHIYPDVIENNTCCVISQGLRSHISI